MRDEHIPPRIVVRIIADALAGLAAAHEAVDMRGEKLQVVHRDVSPHNILVGTDGRSRIIDFGIAKAAKRITTTTRDVMKGKLAYMSPEQARQQPLDARADLFAMGAVLHEALTGDQLFKGEDQADVLLAVLIGEIRSPSVTAREVPPELDVVTKKALEREPEDRYQTGADFLEGLERSVAPAQGRDVAQIVERYCGADLELRRTTVREILDQPRSSVIPRLSPLPSGGDRISNANSSARRRSSGSKSDVTMAATPSMRNPGVMPPSRPSRKRAVVAAGLGVSVIAGAIALTAVLRAPGTPPPAISASSSQAHEGVVPLVLTADAPIEGVTVDGLRSINLNANVARVHVAPWSGQLVIRATLKGGAVASALVSAAGPHEVKLVTLTPPPERPVAVSPPEPTAAPQASGSASSASSASKKPKKPVVSTAPSPPKPPSQDLKPNPFL
jgi:serine/threonine-protein kinase